MSYQTTYRHFRPRMRKIIRAIKDEVGGEDWEDNADQYGYHLALGEGDKDGLDISLMLEDAEEYDGEDGKGQGSFSFSIVRIGGEIISHFVPYNYTADVWVSLKPAGWPELGERLSYVEDGLEDIVALIRQRLYGS